MSENTLEYYVAPALFGDKQIGDQVSFSELRDWSIAAYSTNAIRTGGGCYRTYSHSTAKAGHQYYVPCCGITTYIARVGTFSSFEVLNLRSVNVSTQAYGFFGVSSLTCRYNYRLVGNLGYRIEGVSTWAAPARSIDVQTQDVMDPYQTGAEGVGQIHVIDVTALNGTELGLLEPELMLSLEESAIGARFAPQVLLTIPVVNDATYWRYIDPRKNIKSMLDTFVASSYLNKKGIINGDYYVYIVYHTPFSFASENSTPEKELTVAADGVVLDLKTVRQTSFLRVASARIKPSSEAFSSNSDYVRVSISTKTTSSYNTYYSQSFMSWGYSGTYTISSEDFFGVSIFIGGRSINRSLAMNNLDM